MYICVVQSSPKLTFPLSRYYRTSCVYTYVQIRMYVMHTHTELIYVYVCARYAYGCKQDAMDDLSELHSHMGVSAS